MELAQAKEEMLKLNTEESSAAFAAAFADAVGGREQVLVPVHEVEGGFSMELNQHYGDMYVVMFSRRESAVVRPEGGRLITADINSVIDAVYKNPRLAGIAVDPQDAPVYISRKQIDGLTVRKDPRLEERDWGSGVPGYYHQSDLMVIEELTDFALDIVGDYAAKQGYNIIETHSSPVYIPNIVMEKDDVLYYVLVEAAIAPDMPNLRREKGDAMLGYAEKLEAKCLYAPVSIGSRDRERFAQKLALCGDKFFVNFGGFVEMN